MIVVFAGGRYLADYMAGSGPGTSEKNKASVHVITKKSGLPTAGEIAEAKEKLAAALRAHGRMASWHELEDYVETLDAGTVKALMNDINKQGLTSDNQRALQCLMNRWAELAPQGAIAWVLKDAEPSKKSWCTEQIFDAFSARDPAAALAAWTQFRTQPGASAPMMSQFGGGGLGANAATFALNRIFENYAQQNPQGALVALQGLPPGQRSTTLYSFVFNAWVEQDPAAAATAAANLPTSAARNQSLDAVAQSWALQDPRASLAWAQAFPPGKIQDDTIADVLGVVSQSDPATAANDAMRLPKGDNRTKIVNTVLNNWVQSDPVQVLDWASHNLTGDNYNIVTVAALQQESKTNPSSAATAAQDALRNLSNLSQNQQTALQEVVDNAAVK